MHRILRRPFVCPQKNVIPACSREDAETKLAEISLRLEMGRHMFEFIRTREMQGVTDVLVVNKLRGDLRHSCSEWAETATAENLVTIT